MYCAGQYRRDLQGNRAVKREQREPQQEKIEGRNRSDLAGTKAKERVTCRFAKQQLVDAQVPSEQMFARYAQKAGQ